MAESIEFHQLLRKHLNYNPQTGSLTWAIAPNARIRENDAAGYITPAGYCYVTLAGHKTTAARVAWYLGTRTWPERRVISINRDATDLRLCNLELEKKAVDIVAILNTEREDRTVEQWKALYDWKAEDPEFLSEEGRRAKRMIELLS